MAVQQRWIVFACVLSLPLFGGKGAFAADVDPRRTIPVDAAPASSMVVASDDDTQEDNTRSFNTPTDDGRPGEYFFALGVQAVKDGNNSHAMAMYKVAASWAYKPAQYNLGVMYLSGQGVAVDLPRALAWMALAAERGDPRYVRARQLVYAHLSAGQYEQANAIWRDLLPTYGDEAALPRAKARWREARDNATGSRVGSAAAHVIVGGADGTPNHMNKAHYDVSGGGHVSQNPAEVAGVHQGDGSIAYAALRATDNPYDPRVMQATGVATVGPVTPVKRTDTTQDQPAKAASAAVTHP